jgi:adenylate kinase family enzyme
VRVFGPHDDLPTHPRRVLVAGITGVGKSTLALRIAGILDVPYTEIDALYHGPHWTPRESFLADVDALAAGDGWVTEWQYSSARERLAARADTVVWLDLPLRVSLPRLISRSVRRRVRRTPVWAGNVEAPWWHLFTGQDHVLAWAVRSRATYRRVLPTLPGSSGQPQVVRLTSQREVDVWCERLAART